MYEYTARCSSRIVLCCLSVWRIRVFCVSVAARFSNSDSLPTFVCGCGCVAVCGLRSWCVRVLLRRYDIRVYVCFRLIHLVRQSAAVNSYPFSETCCCTAGFFFPPSFFCRRCLLLSFLPRKWVPPSFSFVHFFGMICEYDHYCTRMYSTSNVKNCKKCCWL